MVALEKEVVCEKSVNAKLLVELFGYDFIQEKEDSSSFKGSIKAGHGSIFSELFDLNIIELVPKTYGNFKIKDTNKFAGFVASYLKKSKIHLKKLGSFSSVKLVRQKSILECKFSKTDQEVAKKQLQDTVVNYTENEDGSMTAIVPLSELSKDVIYERVKQAGEYSNHLPNGKPSGKTEGKLRSSLRAREALLFLKNILNLPFNIELLQPSSFSVGYDDAQKAWFLEELNWLHDNNFLTHSSSFAQDKEKINFTLNIESIDEEKFSVLARFFGGEVILEKEKSFEIDSIWTVYQNYRSFQKIVSDRCQSKKIVSGAVSLSGNFLSDAVSEDSDIYKNTIAYLEDNLISFRQVKVSGSGEGKNRIFRFVFAIKQLYQEKFAPNLIEINFYLSIILSQRLGVAVDAKLGAPVYSPFATKDQKINLEKKLNGRLVFQEHEDGFLVSCQNITILKEFANGKLQNIADCLNALLSKKINFNIDIVPSEISDSFETFRDLSKDKNRSLQIIPSRSYYHPFVCENLDKKEAQKLRSLLGTFGHHCLEFSEHSFQTGFFGLSSVYRFEIFIKDEAKFLELCQFKITSLKNETSLFALNSQSFSDYKSLKW